MSVWTKRRRFGWGGTLVLLPCAYFGLLLPNGAPLAEGCSGSGPIALDPGIDGVSIPAWFDGPSDSTGDTYVGRDGFFVIAVDARQLDAELLVDELSIDVVAEGGTPVSGRVGLLKVTGDDTGQYSAVLGWEADAPLEPAQTFDVTVSAENARGPLSASAKLTVRDEVEELVAPEPVFLRWADLTFDTGPRVMCTGYPGACGSTTFGSELQQVHTGTYELERVLRVMVAREITITPVEGKGAFTTEGPWGWTTEWLTFGVSGELHTLAFADRREEYCVSVGVTDLRTGDSVENEYCKSPAEFENDISDSIQLCALVSDEHHDRWCRVTGDPNAGCPPQPGTGEPVAGSGGVGGSAGVPNPSTGGVANGTAGGSVTAGSGPAVTPPDDAGEGSNDESVTTITEGGCGCRTGRERSAPDAPLVVGAGLFLLAVLRGRSRGRGAGGR